MAKNGVSGAVRPARSKPWMQAQLHNQGEGKKLRTRAGRGGALPR